MRSLERSGQGGIVAEPLEAAFKRRGLQGLLQAMAERTELRAKTSYVSSEALAELYALAGDKEKALQALDRAFLARDSMLIYIRLSPIWDSLRGEPRFQELVNRLKPLANSQD